MDMQSAGRRKKICINIRCIQVILMISGLFIAHAVRTSLSVAIVEMVSNKTVISSDGITSYHQDFNWSSQEQGFILSAFFWFYTFSQVPGGLLAYNFGPKLIFGISIFGAAFTTCLTPTLTFLGGYKALFFIRALQGVFEGMTYPSITQYCSWWTPSPERSIIVSLSFSGGVLGTISCMAASGVIADHLGWPAIYYIFGAMGIVWTVFWIFLASETPEKHPCISNDEVNYIKDTRQLSAITLKSWAKVPWCKILTSGPVWAVSYAIFAEYWSYYTMQTELPSYLSHVLHFKMGKTGFLAALPYIVMLVFIFVGSQVSDCLRRRNFSTTFVRKLFICLGNSLQFIFLLLLSYATDKTSIMLYLTLGIGFGGLSFCSFNSNVLDLSPRYPAFIMIVACTFSNLTGMLAPIVASTLVSSSEDNWFYVFLISSLICLSNPFVFTIFGSGEIQPWNDYTDIESSS